MADRDEMLADIERRHFTNGVAVGVFVCCSVLLLRWLLWLVWVALSVRLCQ